MAVAHFSISPTMVTHGMKSNIFDDKVLHVSGNSSTTLTPPLMNSPMLRNGSFIPSAVISQPPCQWILYADVGNSGVRIWDLIILIPNALFLMFLLWRLKSTVSKLRTHTSPIFMAFYFLVFLVAVISVLRCIVSMTVNASVLAGDIADKVLWLILRFFLLATELSVVTFGLAFGHLDSHTSIRRVVVVTFTVALAYSCTQGTLEFVRPDPKFHVESGANATENFDIFAHGGMIFWFSSSLFFSIVYSVIFILPWTNLKTKLSLPSRKSFYYYSLFLAILNLTQAVGSGLIYFSVGRGLCVVDVTTYVYFTCFDPLVYGTFLREFFSISIPSIPFSYKHQVDEIPDEDTLSLPYQTPFERDKDEGVAFSNSFDSTHFNRQSQASSPNGSVNTVPPSLSINSDYYQASA
ncbi:transmembrane protein adipocyte-associated 1 homolog isoform X1 [Haliotis rubra]|uniref:transmembrane protein adipocyte-associated 1 homolog isoform X1 n=1 Tax=Haliotis rubra TaxID=36100 RepID=UPI001EE569C2|nr:transmembrane protein adipocyte-associated 1 homolog isoform X1 [Haliotis rubra]XP_046570495.1 transmembrane protein adipocyte-associated 1 homolog isoform X1 [Haliotis rubra]XP_046570496.1 transmembrane protein adipocyte-associated 1 homolog isoform X1 [Haliotis rubra]XP_046570497.1 transmembrane protein adipocyte-associated 1 homolog isoform X1 [Haliotis rubra]